MTSRSEADVLAELDRVLDATPADAAVVRPLPRWLVDAAAAEIRKLRRYNAAAAERISRLHRGLVGSPEPDPEAGQ